MDCLWGRVARASKKQKLYFLEREGMFISSVWRFGGGESQVSAKATR